MKTNSFAEVKKLLSTMLIYDGIFGAIWSCIKKRSKAPWIAYKLNTILDEVEKKLADVDPKKLDVYFGGIFYQMAKIFGIENIQHFTRPLSAESSELCESGVFAQIQNHFRIAVHITREMSYERDMDGEWKYTLQVKVKMDGDKEEVQESEMEIEQLAYTKRKRQLA